LDFKYSGENICKIGTDLLVVGMFKGDKFSGSVKSVNDALGDVLKTICGDEKFDGDLGKSVTVSSTFGKIGAKRVLLLGLGINHGSLTIRLEKRVIWPPKSLKLHLHM